MSVVFKKDQAETLRRAPAPEAGTLSPEAARSYLTIEPSVDDQFELRRLAESAPDGSLFHL